VHGITETARVQKALWDGLNNPQRVSLNLLSNNDVDALDVEGKKILLVSVRRASRKQRPIFVGANPLTGTFRRNHEGDYRCPDEVIRRMLAEQVEDDRDSRVLPHYGFGDLDAKTFARYRNHFKARSPDHFWNNESDQEFLRLIGGWRRDRERNDEGLTAAGLLMFGKLTEIKENFPYYMLDYQERPEPKTELRWVDRITTDGSWSGNLFDFYHVVIQRLFRDLKVPFRLRGDTRIDETRVHEALREALVNTLIHADYTGRVSVLVVKRPDMFGFRNPGVMRLPAEIAMKGGSSDCRNRRLQDMFRYVGLGEQAGSGIPRVYSAWKSQHWRAPELYDQVEPLEQTIFALRMASLLPAETVAQLERRYGQDSFEQLSEVQKLALVTVALEGRLTHARLRSMTDAHSRDVTMALSSLVQRGLLESSGRHKGSGQYKGTFYFFPGEPPMDQTALAFAGGGQAAPEVSGTDRTPDAGIRSFERSEASSVHDHASSVHDHASSVHDHASSVHSATSSVRSAAEIQELQNIAMLVRTKRRVEPSQMEAVLLELCRGRSLSLGELADLTGRTADTLRIHYLARLIAGGKIRLRYPEKPTHPAQAYTTEKPEPG
jgi:predicted HTH transcriptional regulator